MQRTNRSVLTGPSAPAWTRPHSIRLRRQRRGSIRARMGAPRSKEGLRPDSRVHPRPHGRALDMIGGVFASVGPSAPAWARPSRSALRRVGIRSIRARMGAPPALPRRTGTRRVHPRPHGRASPNQPIASPRITPPMHANIAHTSHLHVSKIRAGQAPCRCTLMSVNFVRSPRSVKDSQAWRRPPPCPFASSRT